MTLPARRVSIVVIGRNEAPRLTRCLKSLPTSLYSCIYVDSGSTDDSLHIAQSLNVPTLQLDGSVGHSAARARNAGYELLRRKNVLGEFVQFIDGDCELVPGWLEAAVAEMDLHPHVAAVCGRRYEMFPEASLFNQLMNLEWDTPVGEAAATGGDFLIRSECFGAAGGFNIQIVAGEEPELGYRLRKAGWKLRRIATEMTRHDAAIFSLQTWFRRERRSGYGSVDVFYRTRDDTHPCFERQIRSAWFWTVGWLSLLAAGCLIVSRINNTQTCVVVAGIWMLITAVQLGKIAIRYQRRGCPGRKALQLAALTLAGKWPQIVGQLIWYRDHVFGRLPELIEYRAAPVDDAARR